MGGRGDGYTKLTRVNRVSRNPLKLITLYILICPNWGDHEDRRETQGLGTIIYGRMNGFIATNVFFHSAQASISKPIW